MKQSNKEVITYEKVTNELKNINLKDMTKEQVFDRFIAYGNNEELNNPEIQKILIKNGYIEELLNMVTIITDDEVIKLLYKSNVFENYNHSGIVLFHGKISEIKPEKKDDIFNINFEFTKFNNTGQIFVREAFTEDEINQIKKEIEPYKDNLIAVCDFNPKGKSSEKYHLKCLLKEIINVEKYMDKCDFKLEKAKKILEKVCNNRLKEIYGQEIPNSIQTRYKNELDMIYENKYESLYVLNYLISNKAKEDKEYYILRGIGSNSFIVYLLGISEINPLDYGLEYEMSYGLKGEKTPEFYYFFSSTYYPNIIKYVKETVTKNISYDTTYIDNILIRYLVHIYIFVDTGIDTLYELRKITGMDYNKIDINDKKIWGAFIDYRKIISYMPSYFKESIFNYIKPKSIKELSVIYALNKSIFETDETENFIMRDFSTRDDIYEILLRNGLEKEMAFEITEFIRMGKANNIKFLEEWKNYENILKQNNIDQFYIEKFKKIQYLYPKSNILNNIIYIIKHIAYMAYFPDITEKIINKYPRMF